MALTVGIIEGTRDYHVLTEFYESYGIARFEHDRYRFETFYNLGGPILLELHNLLSALDRIMWCDFPDNIVEKENA